jgi:hypothetical protein
MTYQQVVAAKEQLVGCDKVSANVRRPEESVLVSTHEIRYSSR